MSDKSHEALVAEVHGKLGSDLRGKAVLTSVYARRTLRNRLSIEFPDLPVVCHHEFATSILVEKGEEIAPKHT